MRAAARRRHALERAAAYAAALGEVAAADPLDALERCVALANARLAALVRLDAREPAALRAEGEALDRLVRTAKSAIDAGLAERRLRIARDWGEFIAAPVQRAMAVLDLTTAEQAAFAEALGREIRALEGAVVGADDP